MKSFVKLAVVATLMMVLLLSAHSSVLAQQQEETPQPSVFLGNLLTDLKSLNLIKSTSVKRRQFDKKEMNESITNLARMVRYLLILKGQGRTEEVTNWVDSLKMSKKFSRSVRFVRKLMRKFAKEQQANGPKFVLPVKGVVQTVMKKALEEMKTLLEQSASAAKQEAVAMTTTIATPAQQQQQQTVAATTVVPKQATLPVNPAQQAWSAVEKMAHKMVKVTKVTAPTTTTTI
ncbi:predicted protein [Naegleria gruberi]|uniref:Predicted protein n=1 Tax=Naegleria gruberi TaxID=5762 RepID=D2VRN0_NAEGR|nr:uncharacterized protein NAEGRDRAFT_80992 [Naegleria gruberi]EFC40491.1 predicted protein [Naegleria gruberi]|eukprot:XP_002673235.1 predicted protein [Naegleria gruberi strain NEG-M]